MIGEGFNRATASAALATLVLGMSVGPIATASAMSLRAAGGTSSPWSARVAGTLGQGLAVRKGPGQGFAVIGALPEGTMVQVVDKASTDASGIDWYQVASDRWGLSGWSDADFLVPVDAAPSDSTASSPATGRTMTALLTAYSYEQSGDGTRAGVTKMGTPVRWGVVAVDPSVIPLGSRIKIDGYDTIFSAEDTGGGIRGNHIDVYFDTYAAAIQFGVQTRTITLL